MGSIQKEIELVLKILKKYYKNENLIIFFFFKYLSTTLLKTIISGISILITIFILSSKIPFYQIFQNFKNFGGLPPSSLNDVVKSMTLFSTITTFLTMLIQSILNSFFEPAFVSPFTRRNYTFSFKNIFDECKRFFKAFLKLNLIFFLFELILLLPTYAMGFEYFLSISPPILIVLITFTFIIFFFIMFYIDLLKISNTYGVENELVKIYLKENLREIGNIMLILSIPHFIILSIAIFSILLILSRIFFAIGFAILIGIALIFDILTNFLFTIYFSVYTYSFGNFLKRKEMEIDN